MLIYAQCYFWQGHHEPPCLKLAFFSLLYIVGLHLI